MIRVLLPFHLRTLAHCASEIKLDVEMPITPITVIDALEKKYPALRGAILEHESRQRRPKIRFFACKQDISHSAMNNPLPDDVAIGREPFMIVGAISGG